MSADSEWCCMAGQAMGRRASDQAVLVLHDRAAVGRVMDLAVRLWEGIGDWANRGELVREAEAAREAARALHGARLVLAPGSEAHRTADFLNDLAWARVALCREQGAAARRAAA